MELNQLYSIVPLELGAGSIIPRVITEDLMKLRIVTGLKVYGFIFCPEKETFHEEAKRGRIQSISFMFCKYLTCMNT